MSHIALHRCLLIALLALTGCQGSSTDTDPVAETAGGEPQPQSAGLRADHPPPPPPTAQVAADTTNAPPARANGLDSPAAVRPDILMVNDMTLSVDEVLYAMGDKLGPAPANLNSREANEFAERIASQVQFEIGSLLLYQEALGGLADQQEAALDQTVQRAFDDEVARGHGGSVARFEKQLSDNGLTLAQYKLRLRRQLLVRSYTREKIRPQVSLRRSELMAYFDANRDTFSEPETRELLMIEAPYDAFLPDGTRWETAGRTVRAKAKLAARRHIRKARDALAGRDFRSVAREYSRSPRAEEGGSWGEIGTPLQAPFDELSAWIFTHGVGHATPPTETDRGWYLAACGAIHPQKRYSFAESQERIREQIVNERADTLAGEYVRRLASRATFSDLNGFVNQAIRAALGR